MSIKRKCHLAGAALTALALALTGCSAAEDSADEEYPAAGSDRESTDVESADSASDGTGATVTVESWRGPVDVPAPPERPAVTDNRAARILDNWGIDVVAAPLDVFPADLSYRGDDSVANMGAHFEPNLEALVAAQPDVVLNGYRFAELYDDIEAVVPDATMVDISMDIVDNDPAGEFRKQLDLLGAIFDKQAEADALYADFEDAGERAAEAYDPEQTVMGLLTSGGNISYVAPVTGRSVGPLFSIIDMTPALEQEGDDNTHGDDISVEAIAQADPDWIIVLDRDAAVASDDDEDYRSARELIADSEALQNVTAVKEDQIIYLAEDFYLTEDIMAYTVALERMAEAFAK
ncbi:MAG: ABC transporter substrate-binding protein [Flaviflexus sp.]|nr:ABC transporter substrate-binding protein [Flaviflexus sp.]